MWLWHTSQPSREETTSLTYSREVALSCLEYARGHEGAFPPSLEGLAQTKSNNERFLQEIMALGTWDYRGINRKITENRFILAVLHVPAGHRSNRYPYWVIMGSDGSVELMFYLPPGLREGGSC